MNITKGKPMPVKKTNTDKKVKSEVKTITLQAVKAPVAAKSQTIPQAQKTTEFSKEYTKYKAAVKDSSAHQAVLNHHNNVLQKRLGKKQKQKLYNQILSQIDNHIFTLPDGMSHEEFAYAFSMYRAYGVKSSLADALKSNVKLTEAQNAQILEDIAKAGTTGMGVKRMADRLHKKQNMNLKQWRQARVKAGLAA